MPTIDCLCAGIVVADHICEPLPNFPPPGGLATTAGMSFAIGGCAANVAADLAKLNLTVELVGCVGNDLFGGAVCELLSERRVRTRYLQVSSEHPTSQTMVVNIAGEDRRFLHCVGANAVFDASSITPDVMDRTRVVYVGGFGLLPAMTPDAVNRVFRLARERNVPTVLDVVLPSDRDVSAWVRGLLPHTDYFFPNSDEGLALTGLADAHQQAQRFLEWGARNVCVTCGPDGAVLADRQGVVRSSGHRVEAIDGTGAGDAFVAAFIDGLLERETSVDCLRRGAAAGALCVRQLGATAGFPTRSELLDFVAEHPLAIEPLCELN